MRLIDADELKKKKKHSKEFAENIVSVAEIDWQPTVEAEPVLHGTWKPVSEDWRHQIEWWECSECNFSASTKYNYCPNCGAKMDAE